MINIYKIWIIENRQHIVNVPLSVCSILVGSIAGMIDDASGFVGVVIVVVFDFVVVVLLDFVVVVVVDFVVVVSENNTEWENLKINDEN